MKNIYLNEYLHFIIYYASLEFEYTYHIQSSQLPLGAQQALHLRFFSAFLS